MIGRGMIPHVMKHSQLPSPGHVERGLSTIVPGLVNPLRTASLSGNSSEQLATRHSVHEHDTIAPCSSMSELSYPRSHAVFLSIESSVSTWPFTCQSARRAEQEQEDQEADSGDSIVSFRSLSGWGVASANDQGDNASLRSNVPDASDDVDGQRDDLFPSFAQLSNHRSFITDSEFDALPDWSDVGYDPEYNKSYICGSEVWSVSSTASSGGRSVQNILSKKWRHTSRLLM
jgi:hypothetical protein